MTSRVRQLLLDNEGILSRTQVVSAHAVHSLESALSSRHLTAIWPGVYTSSDLRESLTPAQLHHAAVLYGGPGATLSHITALAALGLLEGITAPTTDVHLAVPYFRDVYPQPHLVIHRQKWFEPERDALTRNGLPVTRPEVALVQTWDWVHRQGLQQEWGGLERAALITSVQRRRTTIRRLWREVKRRRRAGGRAQLRELLDLLDQGCHSELELMGLLHLFQAPGMPRSYGQVRVDLAELGVADWDGGVLFFDRFFLPALVNVELDGLLWHQGAQRRRDTTRDSALFSLGIATVRLGYHQLLHRREQTLAELRATLQLRQQQLALHPLPFTVVTDSGEPRLVRA